MLSKARRTVGRCERETEARSKVVRADSCLKGWGKEEKAIGRMSVDTYQDLGRRPEGEETFVSNDQKAWLTMTMCTHVGGNHDGGSSGLELSEDPVSLLLLLVTVDGERGPSVLSEVLCDVVGDSLGGGEDDDLGVLVRDGVEVLDELASLLKVGADLNELLDVVVGGELHRSNVDLDRVLEEVGSESLDLLGPGGREEQRLSVRSDLGDNLPDLRLESHVEHSVGLVHDEVGHSSEVDLAGLEHVDQSSGGGDDDLGSSLEVSDLSSLGHSSVHGSVSDSRRLSKLGALGLGLDSELSGRGEDEHDRSVSGREEGLGVDVDHGGEGERDRLSGSGLGDGDHISSREGHRPGLALNRGRGRESHGVDLGHDVVGETSLVEVGHRLGDVRSLDLKRSEAKYMIVSETRTKRGQHRQGRWTDPHGVLGPVGLDLRVVTSSDSLVLNVEVLLEL